MKAEEDSETCTGSSEVGRAQEAQQWTLEPTQSCWHEGKDTEAGALCEQRRGGRRRWLMAGFPSDVTCFSYFMNFRIFLSICDMLSFVLHTDWTLVTWGCFNFFKCSPYFLLSAFGYIKHSFIHMAPNVLSVVNIFLLSMFTDKI